MALLAILIAMGIAYSLLTTAPKPVRQFELSAVWATLGLIAAGVLHVVDPAVALVLAGVIVAPLWYLTVYMCDQYAQTESENTARLWREWRATVGNRRSLNRSLDQSVMPPNRNAQVFATDSLSRRLDGFENGQIVEEIEITQVPEDLQDGDRSTASSITLPDFELAPLEEGTYRRRRAV